MQEKRPQNHQTISHQTVRHQTVQQDVEQHVENAEVVVALNEAPDLSGQIWRRHQQRKWGVRLATAAGIAMLGVVLLLQQVNLAGSGVIAQNHQLEKKLASFSNTHLTIRQSVLMDNWYHELSLIDEKIEQQGDSDADHSLWLQRSKLLSQMVAFYSHPFEVYEL